MAKYGNFLSVIGLKTIYVLPKESKIRKTVLIISMTSLVISILISQYSLISWNHPHLTYWLTQELLFVFRIAQILFLVISVKKNNLNFLITSLIMTLLNIITNSIYIDLPYYSLYIDWSLFKFELISMIPLSLILSTLNGNIKGKKLAYISLTVLIIHNIISQYFDQIFNGYSFAIDLHDEGIFIVLYLVIQTIYIPLHFLAMLLIIKGMRIDGHLSEVENTPQ